MNEYAIVRKGLKCDMEVRALRKADEYYYDALTKSVFDAWAKIMRKTVAIARKIRGRSVRLNKRRVWGQWRDVLDVERMVWWEANKHASAQGKNFNERYYFAKFVKGVGVNKVDRINEAKVANKLAEVKGWLK